MTCSQPLPMSKSSPICSSAPEMMPVSYPYSRPETAETSATTTTAPVSSPPRVASDV